MRTEQPARNDHDAYQDSGSEAAPLERDMDSHKHRIVIAGGSFGGMNVAYQLRRKRPLSLPEARLRALLPRVTVRPSRTSATLPA